MRAWRTIPEKARRLIEGEASAVNVPRIGCHENVAFTAIQVNVSAAEPYSPPPQRRETLARPDSESSPALPGRRTTRQTITDDSGVQFTEPTSDRSAYCSLNFVAFANIFSSSPSESNWFICILACGQSRLYWGRHQHVLLL